METVLIWVVGAVIVGAVGLLTAYHSRFMEDAAIGRALREAMGGPVSAWKEIDRVNAETDLVAGRGFDAAERRCKCGHKFKHHARGDSPSVCFMWGCSCQEFKP